MPGLASRPDVFKPAFDGQICSVGYEVIDWLTEFACHGPGDVQGDPLDFDDETFDFIVAAYEVDPSTGRRVKSKVVYSAPKGRAKSETHTTWLARIGERRFTPRAPGSPR